jgi:hypothetical protein
MAKGLKTVEWAMKKIGMMSSVVVMVLMLVDASYAGEKLKQITICRDSRASGSKGVRTLRVYEGDDQTCKATYSKTDVEQTVGLNRSNKQCDSILEGIRKNLEESHWSCKKMNSVSVLESKEAKEQPAHTL